MNISPPRWLDTLLTANTQFCSRVQPGKLPTQRTPGTVAVITCMDPRLNLEAIGLPPFKPDGGGSSSVRVIRTIGAMAEARSLVIGIFLAGIQEIAVLMHTDCGCCAAFGQVGKIAERMEQTLEPERLQSFKATVGEPFPERLRVWLKAFADPYKAVQCEVAAIKALPFVPASLVVHGLVYELASGRIEVVVNGYQS